MEEKSDEEVQEAALQVLRNIYGKEVQQPVACAVTRWAQDPYSKGEALSAQGYALRSRAMFIEFTLCLRSVTVDCFVPKLGCAKNGLWWC